MIKKFWCECNIRLPEGGRERRVEIPVLTHLVGAVSNRVYRILHETLRRLEIPNLVHSPRWLRESFSNAANEPKCRLHVA